MIILYLCKIKITHKTQHITHFQEKMGDKITRMEQGMQRRTELLLGKDNLEKLQADDLPVETESSTAAVSFTFLAYIAMPELSCERLIYL